MIDLIERYEAHLTQYGGLVARVLLVGVLLIVVVLTWRGSDLFDVRERELVAPGGEVSEATFEKKAAFEEQAAQQAAQESTPTRPPAAPETVKSRIFPTGLLVPVEGVASEELADTFEAPRSEGRTHNAIDILAPTGTPVLAAASGTIITKHDSKRGGLSVYQRGPQGTYVFYYCHLDRYAEGVKKGKAIRQGDLIGYVGSTGNATTPHLHFALWTPEAKESYWTGTPLNPYDVLVR